MEIIEKQFDHLVQMLRQPSLAILRATLHQSVSLPEAQHDYLIYLAGFTHFAESQALLADFDIKFVSKKIAILDTARREVHVKVLLQDLVHEGPRLFIEELSSIYHVQLFDNRIYMTNPEGRFVDGIEPFAQTLPRTEYFNYISQCVNGLQEKVASVRVALNGIGEKHSLVLHFAQVPIRNVAVNYDRLFCNAYAVVSLPSSDRDANLSFERLSREGYLQHRLCNTHWFILPTSGAETAREILNSSNVAYTSVEWQGIAPLIQTVTQNILQTLRIEDLTY